MPNPEITILMPAYNAEYFIKEAIESIINQSFKNWILLISDDCSEDNTFNIAQEYANRDSRIKVFAQEKNQGYLKNTNTIWEIANTKYITFQDADDTSHPSRLELQYNYLEKHAELSICSTDFSRINTSGNILQTIKCPKTDAAIRDGIKRFILEDADFPVFAGSLFFNKKVSDEIGFYQPFFHRKGGEDWDWILRAIRNYGVVNISEQLYFYTQNPGSVTQDVTVDKLINGRLIKKIHLNFEENNVDLIAINDRHALTKLENSLKAPFLKDKSIIIYERTLKNIYYNDFKGAFNEILKALFIKPFRLKYLKTFKFIIKNLL